MTTYAPRVLIDFDADGALTADDAIGSLFPYTIGTGPDGTIGPVGAPGAAPVIPSLEDVTPDVRSSQVVIKRGRDVARELAPIRAGTLSFVLNNEDGRYSSRNVASPLYGQIKSGLTIRVDATDAGTTYPLSVAYSSIPDERPVLTDRSVGISAVDGLGRTATPIYTGMFLSIRIDQAIAVVLDTINWPADLRSLDTARTTMVRWWAAGVTGLQALRDLVTTEGPGAMLYVDGSGVVVFESRHYRLLTARSTTSQATFTDTATEPAFSSFAVVPGESGIVNAATVPVRSYALAALGPIWSGPSPLVLGPGQVWTTAFSTTEEAFDNAVDPTAGAGDFTVTAGSVVSATNDRVGGKIGYLTITAGAGGATLTGLRVRAQTVTVTEQLVSNTIDAAASIDAHGLQALPSDFVPSWIPTTTEALDFCNAVVSRNQTDRAMVAVGVNNGTGARLTQALQRRISDRITATDTSPVASFDGDAIVEAVEYRLDSHGDALQATFYCEEAVNQSFWILGDAVLGLLGETTIVGY